MLTTLPPFLRLIPRTPMPVRLLVSRASVAEKRIALPVSLARKICWSSVSNCTPISRSPEPSTKPIAYLPAVGILAKASIELRRTMPCSVANTMLRLAQVLSSSGKGSTLVTRSSAASGKRFTIGRPLVVGPPSGSFQTFMR